MTTVQVSTIDATIAAGLRARFRGALLRPGEEGYEEARRSGTAPSTGGRR